MSDVSLISYNECSDESCANLMEALLYGYLTKSEEQILIECITNADLRGANLAGADLRGASLSSVDLAGTDMKDVICAGIPAEGK